MNEAIKKLDVIETKIKIVEKEKDVAFTFAEHERLDKELHDLEHERVKLLDKIFFFSV